MPGALWKTLKRGDTIEAHVVELLPGSYLIAKWQGNLIRIKNETGRTYQAGEKLNLRVERSNPLSLKLMERPSSIHINRFV